MKKYYFLTFTYLFIVLLPVCSSAQFVVSAVKAGSGGIPPSGVPIPIPIDTIRPGVDFGIRILGTATNFAFELTTVKLDEDKKSTTFGQWVKDSASHIYPNINLTTDAAFGSYTTDEAYYKFADSIFMCPFKDTWIRIVMKTPGGPAGVGLDSSKPLLVLAGPIDSAQHTIAVYPNPMGAASPTTEISIQWPHSYNDNFEIKIFDTFGYLVKDFIKDNEVQGINTGRYMYVKWDGKNTSHKKVASGVYLICVKVMEGGKEAAIWKQKIGVAW